MTQTELPALLAELEDTINAEGFGCACMPTATCSTCQFRKLMDKTIRKPFEKLRAALLAREAVEVPPGPTNEQIFSAMQGMNPNWNAYGQTREAAVYLALNAYRALAASPTKGQL